MIVTRSRLHAVRYRLAVDAYLKKRSMQGKRSWAFSGTVRDPETGAEFYRTGMNGVSEAQTAKTFAQARVSTSDRGGEVPDRVRSAAPAHDVRG